LGNGCRTQARDRQRCREQGERLEERLIREEADLDGGRAEAEGDRDRRRKARRRKREQELRDDAEDLRREKEEEAAAAAAAEAIVPSILRCGRGCTQALRVRLGLIQGRR
jgi:hypothetical protein